MNKLKASFFLGYKGIIKGNMGTTLLTIAVMTLAFINLLFLSSILLGLVNTMNRQGINNLYGNIVIEPEDKKSLIVNSRKITDLVESVPGVVASSRHYKAGGLFTFDKFKNGQEVNTGRYTIISIDPSTEKEVTDISKAIIAGEYLDDKDRDQILIGKDISGGYEGSFEKESLGGVVPGDEVTVLYENGIERKYTVKGIFNSKFVQSDKAAFLTNREMESILGVSNGAHEIIIKVDDSQPESSYIEKFKEMGLKESIYPWNDYMGITSSFTQSFTLIRTLLSAIALLVAGITIYIVVYINILNKRRQIGILQAIGIDKSIIVRSYVMQALFYAVSGIALGLIIMRGVLVPYFIGHPLKFPVGDVRLEVAANEILISIVVLMLAGFISGYAPARKQTNKTILEAIWG